MAGVKRSSTGMNEYSKSKKVARPSPNSLVIDLHSLTVACCPKFRKPEELAVFSPFKPIDKLSEKDTETKEDTNAKSVGNFDQFTVKSSCARALKNSPVSNLMHLFIPKSLNDLSYDLNVGYGTQIQKDSEHEFMSLLLRRLDQEKLIDKSDFVCWRGLLTKISASPYDAGGKFDDGMKIVVQKVGRTIYMYEFPTEQNLEKQENVDDRQKLMTYWGMKFESYVTAKPGEKPNVTEPMNFNDEYGVVVSTKLASHSLIFGGEVDCLLSKESKKYVELKTTREFNHAGQERSFRKFKLIKWWLQSFLIGIEDILCGFRDDNGIVKRCKWFRVSDIPHIIKQDRDHWKPAACLAFLEQFLDFVKETAVKDFIPYVYMRQPNERTFHMDIDKEGANKFLPHWFVAKHATG